jgi:hypothetical protein
MKRFLQPFTQHKEWVLLGGLCILGVALVGYGISSPTPGCQSNVMGLSCSQCLQSNAASSGVGTSISGCLPFPFAMWFYDHFGEISALFGFVMVVLTVIAGVNLSSLGQADPRER